MRLVCGDASTLLGCRSSERESGRFADCGSVDRIVPAAPGVWLPMKWRDKSHFLTLLADEKPPVVRRRMNFHRTDPEFRSQKHSSAEPRRILRMTTAPPRAAAQRALFVKSRPTYVTAVNVAQDFAWHRSPQVGRQQLPSRHAWRRRVPTTPIRHNRCFPLGSSSATHDFPPN